MDNYEWGSYEPRFGLYYVNFSDPQLNRIPRLASRFITEFSSTKCISNKYYDHLSTSSTPKDSVYFTLIAWVISILAIYLIYRLIKVVINFVSGHAKHGSNYLYTEVPDISHDPKS